SRRPSTMRTPPPRPSADRRETSMAIQTKPRKFLNDPADVVKESLAGLAAAHGDLLRYDRAAQIIVCKDAPRAGKVALVSGGGSGHEPLHGGFVGRGMLDAACPGEVFTSPVPDRMLAATRAVDGGAGVIHIVKNYTGDVLNFKMAAEEAADAGIKVEAVVIDDDVAVQDSLYTAGRRGVGATVLAEKIAGAAAERGDDVQAVAATARRVNERGRSFGIALSSCIPPSAGKPIFDLPEGEMEVGIGIHGEPGRRREPLGNANEIAGLLVEAVVSDLKPAEGSKALVFVNGMVARYLRRGLGPTRVPHTAGIRNQQRRVGIADEPWFRGGREVTDRAERKRVGLPFPRPRRQDGRVHRRWRERPVVGECPSC